MLRDQLYPALRDYLARLEKDFPAIPPERVATLVNIQQYLSEKKDTGEDAHLIVICTHNSRRSHFGQLWLQAAAAYYDLPWLHSYSGGTEATAFNPRAVAAARRAGFQIPAPQDTSSNPGYEVSLGDTLPKAYCYSKKFDAPDNPSSGFAAIMVCTDADENCPFVPGTEKRFSLPFIDPKAADDTAEEAQVYDWRCRQIAVELSFLCAQF